SHGPQHGACGIRIHRRDPVQFLFDLVKHAHRPDRRQCAEHGKDPDGIAEVVSNSVTLKPGHRTAFPPQSLDSVVAEVVRLRRTLTSSATKLGSAVVKSPQSSPYL